MLKRINKVFIFSFFFIRKNKFYLLFFFFQAEDGIRDPLVTGVQTCALPISSQRELPNRKHKQANLMYKLLRYSITLEKTNLACGEFYPGVAICSNTVKRLPLP